jgi:hypothetical protein
MPHKFIIQCYEAHHLKGRASIGDVVYLKSRVDLPMHVVYPDLNCNRAAGHKATIKVRYLGLDMQPITAEFKAEELTL